MSNKFDVTIDGMHKTGSLAFLTVDGVHRKIRSGYLVVDGVYKQCYTCGVAWQKYSCDRTTVAARYVKQSTPSGGATSRTLYNDSVYPAPSSYEFSSSKGFYTNDTSTWTGDSMIGFYDVEATVVQKFDSVQASSVDGGYTIYNMKTVASAKYYSSYISYSKGDANYGNVYAEEGAYPDAELGYTYVTTFTEGGITYTVMRNGSTYYCYCLA